MQPAPPEHWEQWNAGAAPRYPHERVIQFTFRRFPAERRAGTPALDWGCGSGVNALFLAENGFAVSASDLTAAGIARTRARLAERGLSADLRQESIDAPTFAPDSFELLISLGVLDAAGPAIAARALPRIWPALRRGAQALFFFASDADSYRLSQPGCGIMGYSRAQVEALFAPLPAARLEIDRVTVTYGGGATQQDDWLVTVER